MATPSQPLKDALPNSITKQPVDVDSLSTFQKNCLTLLNEDNADQREEYLKKILSTFLEKTYFADYAINIKEDIDLVIRADNKISSPVEVLFEVKSLSNKNEMPQEGNLNCKALHEAILYFLRERDPVKPKKGVTANVSLKYIILTNTVQWYVFDANVFEKLFFASSFRKQYRAFGEGRLSSKNTSVFYKDVAAPYVKTLLATEANSLKYAYLNLQDVAADLRTFRFLDPKPSDPDALAAYEKQATTLNNLYWFFSPEHLLKKPLKNDSNSLNKAFYDELLHIIGLTEVKEGSKKVITRCPEGERNYASLLENTINVLQSQGELRRQDVAQQYGDNEDEQLFGIALELVVTWLNRVLFLKLLEAQLLSYHDSDPNKDQYAFLNSQRIPDTQTLNVLFFNVLAIPQQQRTPPFREMFAFVPYLNSSLFEATALERDMFTIASVSGGYPLPIYGRTVFKDAQDNKITGDLPTLSYLLQFLDAYKFSSEGNEAVSQDKKMLINASVLGLIFEKLNGYKDGSFFTPGFITMYMCRESLRRAVVQKFNDEYNWTCQTLIDVHNNIDDKQAANAIINRLKICDPAVGSGHFLVSALNELIAIKSELGILRDNNGRTLRDYGITVENDELIVQDVDGGFFAYNPNNQESQRVQETLFREKQTLIENCLFGVDINPNSVKICRLRLWIELLKHAYYKQAGDNRELETLPNIDINIKTGNSLISRFGLDASIGTLLKSADWDIQRYQDAVQTYRNAASKDEKRQMEALIDSIENNFAVEITNSDPDVIKLENLQNKLATFDQSRLFDASKAEQAEFEKTQKAITALEVKLEARRNNPIYDNAFEWRFRFPEVLDDEGNFVGFDVIIGNPPYIRQELIRPFKPILQQNFVSYVGTADIFVYFFELAVNLLRPRGVLSYIVSNKYFRSSYGKKVRSLLTDNTAIEVLLDFGDAPIFEEATAYPSILLTVKDTPKARQFLALSLDEADIFQVSVSKRDKKQFITTEDFHTLLDSKQFSMPQTALNEDGWRLERADVRNLLDKLKSAGTPFGEYVDGKFYRGILTGFNEAFVIDGETKAKLIAEHPFSAEIIKPFLRGRDVKRWQVDFADQYLIFTRRGIDIDQYPAIKKHLTQYKDRLTPGVPGGRKPGSYAWYEIQDNIAYWQEFEQPKILYQEIATYQAFAWDASGAYANNKTFLVPDTEKYLLGILNSKLIWFFLGNFVSKLNGGAYMMQTSYVSQIPVVEKSDTLTAKVETMLDLHKQKAAGEDVADAIRVLDAEIDALVYQLYDLTEEEIAIVEGTA